MNPEKNKFVAATLALSLAGLLSIAAFEGMKPVAYRDLVGIPTVCAGHTQGVRIGQVKTENECQALLREDASDAGKWVGKCTAALVTQAQYDALVSLAFNIGGPAYCQSTLVRKLNAGDCQGAADEFGRWVRAKGKVLSGLKKRRAEERAQFLTGCES